MCIPLAPTGPLVNITITSKLVFASCLGALRRFKPDDIFSLSYISAVIWLSSLFSEVEGVLFVAMSLSSCV